MHIGNYNKLQVDQSQRKRESGGDAKLQPIMEDEDEAKKEDPNQNNLLPEDDPSNYLDELENPKPVLPSPKVI